MLVPSQIYYARLVDLIAADKLPESLGFLKNGIETLLGDLYYQNLVVEKNRNGSAAYYRLEVVSIKRLALPIPGAGGINLTFFPSLEGGQHSVVPLNLSYRWDILQFIDLDDIPELLADVRSAYELLLKMLNISTRDLLEETINKFFLPYEDRLQAFADWFPHGTLVADTTTETPYRDLLDQIDQLAGVDLLNVIFDDILTPSTSLFDGLGLDDLEDRALYLFKRWIGDLTIEELGKMLIPHAQASILKMPIALEFPPNILKRVDGVDGPAMLGFDVGKLTFSTDDGVVFDKSTNLWFTKSEILNSGITLEIDAAYLDLSTKENITGANLDGRPDEFVGVHIPEAIISFPESWGNSTGQGAELVGTDLVIGSEGGFSGTLALEGDTAGIVTLELGPLNIEVHSFLGDIDQNHINALEFSGILTIDGFESADTANAGQLQEFPFFVAFDDTGNTWTINLQNTVPVKLMGGYEVLISSLTVVLDSNGLVSGTVDASLTLGGIKDASTNLPAVLDFLIEIVPDGSPNLAVTLANSPIMALEFQQNVFHPVGTGDEPTSNPLWKTQLLFGFGTGAVYWDSLNGFVVSSAEVISFTRSEVLGTGLIIDFEGGEIDLSKVTNIQAANDAGLDAEFVGAFIQQASVTLPDGFGAQTGQGGTMPMILGEQLLFGNIGGFSGQLSLVGATGETLDLNFGGAIVKIDEFLLDFDQSSLETGSNIHGHIIIPGIKCANTGNDLEVEVGVDFLGGGIYEVTAGAPECPITIGSLEATINELTVQFDRDGLILNQTFISLTVTVPTNETGINSSIDVELQLLPDGFKLLATDTDGITFPVGPLDVTLEYFWLQYNQGQAIQTIINGSVFIPTNSGGATVMIDLSLTNTGFILDASSQPQDTGGLCFDVGGAEVCVHSFYLELDRETNGSMEFVQSSITGSIDLQGELLNIEIEVFSDGFRVYAAALDTDGLCFPVSTADLCIKEFEFTYRRNEQVPLQASVNGSLWIPDDEGKVELELTIDFDDQGFVLEADAMETGGVPIKLGGASLYLDHFILRLDRLTAGGYELEKIGLTGTLYIPSNPSDLVIGCELCFGPGYYEVGLTTTPAWAAQHMLDLSWFKVGVYSLYVKLTKTGNVTTLDEFEVKGLLAIPDMKESSSSTNDKLIYFNLSQFKPLGQPNEYTIELESATVAPAGNSLINIGDVSVDISYLMVKFTKNKIIEGDLQGIVTFDQANGTSPQGVILEGWLDDLGFGITTEFTPPIEADVAGLVLITIHKVGLGKIISTDGTEETWFLQIGKSGTDQGLDFKLLQEIPMVNKFLPSSVNINSLKIFDDGSAEDADIVFTWEGMSNESSTPDTDPNGDIEDSKQMNKGLANVLTIKNFNLGIKSAAGGLLSKFTLGGTIRLGPLAGTVEGVGVSADIEFKNNKDGNLGPIDIGGFKLVPPTGIGISFDSEAISGGGFLSFDFENERYAGVLELTIKDTISIKAIGLVTTRLPDGSKGFSLLILITAEFTPVQLGLGFTLNGVGGLFGLHRTVEVDTLREGVRNSTLDSIMFPENPVENAMQIISDLRAVFPPERNRFIIGPMIMIGWGTPSLITAEIGLVAEISTPLALENLIILGIIKTILPTEEEAILKIQINFVGVLNFKEQYITFDASIYDSRLLDFTLQGDMIFRLKWGSESNFLLSVGGFHPMYTPPPMKLPAEIKRLGIIFFNSSSTRLSMLSYFAVTSNTVQFGSRVDFYQKLIMGLKVIGLMAFDALFQFNPFKVMIHFAASLAVKKGSKAVLSVYLNLALTGPHPWEANGEAGFKFLGVKVQVKVNITIGKPKDSSLPDINVLPLLQDAVDNIANWRTELPENRHLQVTLKKIEAANDEVVAHPAGVMQITQKVVPLGFTISKFGTQKPVGAKLFNINKLTVGGSVLYPAETDFVREEFAPAHFKEMSQDASLKSPSFETYKSGVRVQGSDTLHLNHSVTRLLEYESFIIDMDDPAPNTPIWSLPGETYAVTQEFATVEAGGGSIGNSPYAATKQAGTFFKHKVSLVKKSKPKFVISNLSNLTQVAESSSFGSYEEAVQVMQQLVQTNPALDGEVQIISGQTSGLQQPG